MNAVGKWTEIHKYTLTVLAHATIRGTGGVESNLRLGRMIVFVLEPGPTSRADSASADVNPASAFILSKVNNQDGDHVPPVRELVSETFGRRGIEGGFRGESSDTTPAGFVPVLCIVEGTSTPTILRYPVYYPSRHPDNAADEKTVGFFQDINRIFFGFINNGIVIRAPADGQIGAPPCGVMVRAKKRWRWQQNQRLWQDMDMAVPHQNPPFQTTGSATELWMRFQQW
ncbi:hypothetical protein GSI_07351 [Ganoderma sinense ZZ0214-1]|uniref:Uncharacterized protein n=1 Tax=Ganoderma sinense ZZ0214-1 TaxID=1077348 RepID=A0A2G8SA48_9APHY|nr:hypothetical protein GSI_07351 [Ganoderma sinense ZZ0214-1]